MPPDHQDRHFKHLACDGTNAANREFLELISMFGFHIESLPFTRRLLLISGRTFWPLLLSFARMRNFRVTLTRSGGRLLRAGWRSRNAGWRLAGSPTSSDRRTDACNSGAPQRRR